MIPCYTTAVQATIRSQLSRILQDDGVKLPLDDLITMLDSYYIRDLAERAIVQRKYLPDISTYDELDHELRRKLYDRMIGGRSEYILDVLEFITRTRDPYARKWVRMLARSRQIARQNPEISEVAKECASLFERL